MQKYFIAVITFVAFFICSCSTQNNPSDVVEDFLLKIEKKNNNAIEHLSPEIQNALGKDKLNRAIEKSYEDIQSKGGIKSINIIDELIENDDAKLKVEIVYGNSSTKTEDIKLNKIDGKWKITLSK